MLPALPASCALASALSSSGMPLSADSIADAVVHALRSSLPTIMASIQGNAPSSSSSASTGGTTTVDVCSGFLVLSSGMFMLPAFVPTFTPLTRARPACGSHYLNKFVAQLVGKLALLREFFPIAKDRQGIYCWPCSCPAWSCPALSFQ